MTNEVSSGLHQIWFGAPGALQLVVQNGDPVLAGGTFSRLGNSEFSGSTTVRMAHVAGRTAFVADAGGVSGRGIWIEDSGKFAPTAQEGEPAPGTLNGIMFHERFDHPVVSLSGDTAFRGQFRDDSSSFADGQGIWSDSGGSLALVALEGDHAPGAPARVVFGSDVGSGSDFVFSRPAINAAGQVAFFATLVGVGQNGIWAQDREGMLQLVARTGDQLLVGPGDSRTIEDVNFGFAERAFNELGQITFSARFSDGTYGVFVSNLVAVPEPSTGFLLVTAGSLVICFARIRGAKFQD